MAFFNYVTREITLKVVYYGPGLSGKTTNLQYLYSILDASSRGKFISLATESDRTLFFDFLPVELGKIKDFSVRFQLYTVPGQIRYNATRKLVLKGADAVVFVADSQRDMKEQNVESFANMRDNLVANNLNPDDIPVVLQYNKRDLPDILSIEELSSDLDRNGYPVLEAVASQGKGVQETFRLVTTTLLKDIAKKHKVDISGEKEAITVKVPEKEKFDLVEEVVVPQARQAERESLRVTTEPVEEISAPVATTPQTVVFPEETPAPQAAEPSRAPAGETEGPAVHARPVPSKTLPIPDEKLASVEIMLREMNQSLVMLRETLAALSREVRESGKQQAEMMKILRELNATMIAKKKKSWWSRLFSR